ncbi:MAG: hypothetical protein IM556_16760 [Pseudanabaena sp. M110S1SP2A07QC]|nr:hypothetical protein [Pseudanabaena sp. M110S1SP2A07QC]
MFTTAILIVSAGFSALGDAVALGLAVAVAVAVGEGEGVEATVGEGEGVEATVGEGEGVEATVGEAAVVGLEVAADLVLFGDGELGVHETAATDKLAAIARFRKKHFFIKLS